MKYNKFFASSVDRSKLSMTIKGGITSIVPIVLVLAPVFGWSVSADDFTNLTNGIDGLFGALEGVILAVTGIISAGWVVVGLFRKLSVGLGLTK